MEKEDLEKVRKIHNFIVGIVGTLFIVIWIVGMLGIIYYFNKYFIIVGEIVWVVLCIWFIIWLSNQEIKLSGI